MVSPVGSRLGDPHVSPTHECQLGVLLSLARVTSLQAEVASLQRHKDHCGHAALSLLQELRQVQASVQLQAAELKKLKREVQQAAWAPEKETLEVSHHWLEGGSSPPTSQAPPFPGVGAAMSWTLNSAQALLPRPGAQRTPRSCVCAGQAVRALGLCSAHALVLAVPQPPEPEQDAGPGQEVPPCSWDRPQQGGCGFGESSGWCRTHRGIAHRVLFPQLVIVCRQAINARGRTQKLWVCVSLRGWGACCWDPWLGPRPLKTAQPALGFSWPPGGLAGQAPGRSGSCVPGWWRSGRLWPRSGGSRHSRTLSGRAPSRRPT